MAFSDDNIKLKMFCNNSECFEAIKKVKVVLMMRWRLRANMAGSQTPSFEDIKLFEQTLGKKELGIKARTYTTIDVKIDLPNAFLLRKNNPKIFFMDFQLPESISK
jgi:hypothetical protein